MNPTATDRHVSTVVARLLAIDATDPVRFDIASEATATPLMSAAVITVLLNMIREQGGRFDRALQLLDEPRAMGWNFDEVSS